MLGFAGPRNAWLLAGKRIRTVISSTQEMNSIEAVDILLTTPDTLPDRYKIEKKLEELVAAIHKYDVNGLGAGDFSGTNGL